MMKPPPRLLRQLHHGEKLLWCGRPFEAGVISFFRHRPIGQLLRGLPQAVAAAFFLLAWAILRPAEGAAVVDAVWLALLAPFSLAVLRPPLTLAAAVGEFVLLRLAPPTLYAVTDRRALILHQGVEARVISFLATDLRARRVRRYDDGSGDVQFPGYALDTERDPTHRHWLLGINDVDKVAKLTKILAERGAEPLPPEGVPMPADLGVDFKLEPGEKLLIAARTDIWRIGRVPADPTLGLLLLAAAAILALELSAEAALVPWLLALAPLAWLIEKLGRHSAAMARLRHRFYAVSSRRVLVIGRRRGLRFWRPTELRPLLRRPARAARGAVYFREDDDGDGLANGFEGLDDARGFEAAIISMAWNVWHERRDRRDFSPREIVT